MNKRKIYRQKKLIELSEKAISVIKKECLKQKLTFKVYVEKLIELKADEIAGSK